MNSEYLMIFASVAVVVQMLLAIFIRPKLHATLLIIVGLGLGVFLTIGGYVTHDQLSVRPLLKSLITSALLSLIIQLVFSILKIAKKRGIAADVSKTQHFFN